MLGHMFSDEEVRAMVETGRTPPIGDFISNRTGKAFTAMLRVESSGKIAFEFPPRKPRGAKSDAPDGGQTTTE
jgi:hypothetical protein